MPKYIEVKTILNRSKKRDDWFLSDYTINPYSACSFNCIYCYIRGSKYGEHMEQSLSVKTNAVELLDKQLSSRAKKGQFGFIVLSSATDPYLQFEAKEQLTRGMLEVILEHKFPVHIITKSNGILRDFDLLEKIDKAAILPEDLQNKGLGGTIISFSFTTLDEGIAGIFEPGAPKPNLRLQTLNEAIKAGFKGGVSLMPLLPYISDTSESLVNFFQTFKGMGANYVLPAGITLFGEGKSDSKTLVFRAIKNHYPHLLRKYHKLFANSHQLPPYYTSAFQAKMREMSSEYQLPIRIIDSMVN